MFASQPRDKTGKGSIQPSNTIREAEAVIEEAFDHMLGLASILFHGIKV